ncbi:uncharacterized protein YecT (DUF1311 family) [Mesorhizobium sp. USDA 4775]|jgi:uncharacterized protein YecT (DUF1311 family)
MSTASMLHTSISSNIRHISRSALHGSGRAGMMRCISSDLGSIMRRILLSACLVVLAGTSIVRAQECDRSDDSQQMMNICAGEDYQAADAKLNAAYQDLISSDDANGKRLLQVAQRAWITFRDAECAHSTAASVGGSIHAMEVSQCLTRLTNDRINQLAASANCSEGDASCASPNEGSDEVQ